MRLTVMVQSLFDNFNAAYGGTSSGGMISANQQIRIEGANTMLGNPVNVGYDENSHIYVAERAKGGGMVLIFKLPMADGNPAPNFSKAVAGASSIYVENQLCRKPTEAI